MTFVHGKDSFFSIDNTSDSPTDISAYITNVDGIPGDTAAAKTTTMTKESETYIAGLHDASITIALIWDATLDGIIGTTTQQKVERDFVYGPSGSSGVKHSGAVLITSYKIGSPVGDVVTASLTLQKTGDLSTGTF